jgi:hypothetical protein
LFTFSQFWTLVITTCITASINGVVYVFVTKSVINALEKERKEEKEDREVK